MAISFETDLDEYEIFYSVFIYNFAMANFGFKWVGYFSFSVFPVSALPSSDGPVQLRG